VGANISKVNTVAANITDVTNYADTYLGPKASPPTTRNDGSALRVGDLYFNTTSGTLAVYHGSGWAGLNSAAVWGPTRTITIGNTRKSVDGSANVSWSLDEIGAARFARLADGTDLNTVVASGFYRLLGTHGNAPTDVLWGQLIVSRGGSNTILQIATGYNNGEIYWRQGDPPDVGGTGSWSAWHRFFHSGNLGAASETASGIVELADVAEARAGTDGTRALSPLRLRDALNAPGSAPLYACRAWVNFNGTGTVAIRASGNASSITDNGVGNYTVNFTTAMPDANYVTVGSGNRLADIPGAEAATQFGISNQTTTSVSVSSQDNNQDNYQDSIVMNVATFR
jgi:hypothetical protein